MQQPSKLSIVHSGTSGDGLEVMFSCPGYVGPETLGLMVNCLEDMRFVRPEGWEPKTNVAHPKEVGMTYLLCRFPFAKQEDHQPEDQQQPPKSFILDDE